MNFNPDEKSKGISTIELTPLVDVVFLLLIFFLLTATYVKNPNIDIDLPKATPQETFTKDNDLTIAIKKDGTIRYDNDSVSILKLKEIFENKIKKGGKNAVVIVKADKGSTHGRVVEVMDLAKSSGFSKLAIAVSAPVESE
ncbi:MAG: biopolymer transporter ExbD [Deltaproteobacteria bacterium]|nr:biopolymer transporter ExbD [Deltaproteobacteria bacterium]